MSKVFEDYAREIEQRNLLSHLRTLMETMHLTVEQAMDALRVSHDERDYYKARL